MAFDSIAEYQAISNEFGEELAFWQEALEGRDGNANRAVVRAFVRMVFAQIEAEVFRLKQMALECNAKKPSLSPGEVAMCLEETFDLQENGNVKGRTAKLRFLPNVRFALMVATKAVGSSSEADYNDPGWQALTKAIPIRDRLMHPKKVHDYLVSKQETTTVTQGRLWFGNQVMGIFEKMNKV
jgi:hypothetical protein